MDESVNLKKATNEGLESPKGDSKLDGNRKSEAGDSRAEVPPEMKLEVSPKAGRGGGPRTKAGKERSRQNAIKHGIFARVAVLEGEPRKPFNSLLQGLLKDFKPEGTLETLLVEKLATLAWRYRRTLVTERAEIRLGMSFNPLAAEIERRDKEEARILYSSMENPGPGLISRLDNPSIRERIVGLLASLRLAIACTGFNPEHDKTILHTVYGGQVPSEMTLLYAICSNPGIMVKGYEEFDLSPEGRKKKYLEVLKDAGRELENYSKLCTINTTRQKILEKDCSGVPEAARLDRMLRYEASLERAFDRTLSQLERIQRMRRGQPVPAPINVSIS